MTDRTFYVTTPIYYVTAKPHLGSLYSTIVADVISRWQRLQGQEVYFLTGTDEHGQKIAQAAAQAGQDPKKFVDSFITSYTQAWNAYHVEYSQFIRTTDRSHIQSVQVWLEKLLHTGDIYKSFYKGWYCTPCETFLTDAEVSDQQQAIPVCLSCARTTEYVSEETYFFRLSAYQDRLLEFYKTHPEFFVPKERGKEVIAFVSAGLKDLSISRTTIQWGIPFPSDPKHVTYVWADALNNYITAVGWGQQGRESEFAKWWPADVHVIGKDIIRFHAVYWPAFLMALGLPLPKQLLAHGWITVNKQKMSKSLGNVVDPMELCHAYGPDPVRYYLLRQMPITHDSNFSLEDLEQHITSDLAHDLGNLLNRLTHLASQHSLSVIAPVPEWSSHASDIRDECWNMVQDYRDYMDDYLFHMALARLWKFISLINGYFHRQEPWKKATVDIHAFQEIMSVTCHSLYTIAYLVWPVMPGKMTQLLTALGVSFDAKQTVDLLEQDIWRKTFMVRKSEPLFEKPESKEMADMHETKSAYNEIDIADFQKIMLAIGTIVSCQALEKSDKLYMLQVDCGHFGMRTILSGIKKHFTQEQLIGKQATFLINLKPRMMMGHVSEGMMLLAGSADTLQLIIPEHSVPNGTVLR